MEKQKNKSIKLKGTVLFTVVSVMMVLIVFVMATLTIASAASKRSYNAYFKNQAYYSARSVVDTTLQELLNADISSNDLKREASKLVKKGDTLELSCELPAGMGKVTDLRVEYAGMDQIGTASFVTGSGDGIIKITATVEMGGQASTYSQYVLKSPAVTIPAISEGALVSMGKGMQSDTTSPKIFGSTYSFNSSVDSENLEEVKKNWSELRNEGSANALHYNSSVYVNTSMTFRFEKGTGIYIGGHMSMQNIPKFFSVAEFGSTGLMYNEIPYIYVGGVFYQDSNSRIEVGTKERPVNIYCGSMNGWNGIVEYKSYGDIYAYDEYVEGSTEKVSKDGTREVPTGLTVFGGGGNGNSILKWVDSLINSTDPNFANHTGGSFYSNGRLQITGVKSTFEGDVIVKEKIIIDTSNNLHIGGSLYAGKGLEINTISEIKIDGGIFLGSTEGVSINIGANINGVVYGGEDIAAYIAAVNAAADSAKVAETQAKIDSEPPSIFPKTMDKEFLFKGDMDITDPDERAKTITIVDIKTMFESFKTTYVNAEGETVTEYKDYKMQPEDDKVCYNTVYKADDIDFTEASPLTSNCTLSGQWNEDIYIQPSPGQSIWICLYNFKLESRKIIVDNTTHPDNPGIVYFFVPEKGMVHYDPSTNKIVETPDGTGGCTGNLELNNGVILTSYYANLNTPIELSLYPMAENPENRPQVPNIYIYMAGGKKAFEAGEPSENVPVFKSDNQSVITGYICAPYIRLIFVNPGGVGQEGAAINYKISNESVPVTRTNVAVIGQVIVGDIEQFTNSNIILQVSPNLAGGSGGKAGEVIQGKWTPISNSYGFGS